MGKNPKMEPTFLAKISPVVPFLVRYFLSFPFSTSARDEGAPYRLASFEKVKG